MIIIQYVTLPFFELWQGEQYLHDGVEVAGVAKITHSCVALAITRYQLLARLLDNAPLSNSHVHIDLQLCHGGICLQANTSVMMLRYPSCRAK